MAGFSKLKPKLARKERYSDCISPFSALYDNAIEKATIEGTSGRPPELRPSSFPICPILAWMKLVRGASIGYWPENVTFQSTYFATVGTEFHEMIQFFIGMSGKIYGNWSCINKKCKKGRAATTLYDAHGKVIKKGKLTRKNTTNNECPCCGEPMRYEEIEVNYRGVKGHIDCIIDMGGGRYWVGDYKTCSNYGIENKILPHKAHLKQIPSYVYILRKKYKLNVVGFSLLYATRDNPWKFKETPFEWNDEWTDYASDLLKGEKRKYKAALYDFKHNTTSNIIQHKPCKSEAYYFKEIDYYHECPMLGVCFEKRKLLKALHKHQKKYKYSQAQADKIIATVDPDKVIYEDHYK